MDPLFIPQMDPMIVVGLEIRTSNQQEMDFQRAQIPGLWKKFHGEKATTQIHHLKEPDVFLGVYNRYEGDFHGDYSLMAGMEVEKEDFLPIGYNRLILPASTYQVFKAKGPMPQTVIETWGVIWQYFSDPSSPHKRTYTADFEKYRFSQPEEVAIHIAVK